MPAPIVFVLGVIGIIARVAALSARAATLVGRGGAQVGAGVRRTLASLRINDKEMVRGINKLRKELEDLQKQQRYATAVALTRTAWDVKREVDAEMRRVFDRPVPFTLRAIGVTPATKMMLVAFVFVRPTQQRYLQFEVRGGTRLPRGRALTLPTDYPRDAYGNVPRSALARLRRQKNVFSGRVGAVSGVWMREGRRLTLLFAYESRAQYKPRLHFYKIGDRVIRERLPLHLEEAMRQAIRTAR